VEQKSYLAEFVSSYEQEAVIDLIKPDNTEKYWIGLEYSENEWKWGSSGENIDYYVNWGIGEPHEQLETSKVVLFGNFKLI